ncbi:TRAP transporter small permease [Acuticoccus sp.]|uniref:TRAP transporter small permease n=1 Tax=Acuticoccus sp. TaxID=1904378 RepID=UPI003B528445
MDHRLAYPRVLRALSTILDVVLAVLGLGICVLTFANAALRGFAGFDLAWSLEVIGFMLLWATFIGAACAMARGAHMRVTEIVAALVPAALQRPLALLIDVAVAALLLALTVYGADIALATWAQRSTVLYYPIGLGYLSMPVGMALCLVFHLANAIIDATSRGAAASDLTPADEETREGVG